MKDRSKSSQKKSTGSKGAPNAKQAGSGGRARRGMAAGQAGGAVLQTAHAQMEARFRVVFESSRDAIGVAKGGIHVFVNPAHLKLFGLPAGTDIAGKPVLELIAPGNRNQVRAYIRSRMKGEYAPSTYETRGLRADGSEFDMEVNVSIYQENGEDHTLVILRDITERKQAEMVLKTREKQLAESQRIAHIGSWEHNYKTGGLFWSDELFRLIGLDPKKDPVDFDLFFRMIHPDDQPAVKKAIEVSLQQHMPYSVDYRFILRDGTSKIIHARAELMPDESGNLVILSGTAQDITDRKHAEDKLRESEDKFRSVFEQASAGIIIADTETRRFVEANTAICDMLGYTRYEMICLSVDDIHPKEDMPAIRSIFEKQRRGEISLAPELPILRKDGSIVYADINATPVTVGGKQCLFGIFNDITERKRTEEALRENRARLDLALQSAHMGVWRFDIKQKRHYFDDLTCQLLGIDATTFTGTLEEFFRAVHPEDCEKIKAVLARTIEQDILYETTYRVIWPDGSVHYVTARGRLVRDDRGQPARINGIVWDITDQRLLEDERLKTQKLESIGTLAGGIAHDFNNLLQGIFGYISMAKMTFDQKEKSLAMLEQAEKALHQSVNLTTQLLTFSKGGKPVKKLISLRPVIEDSVRFSLSGSRSDFRLNIPQELWQAEADEGQLGQVIQNIVLNADQAMPIGGTVIVTAANIVKGDASLPPGLAKGDYVVIAIQDTGVGIPEQYLSKIFDPYFTTKEKGSGLGLATAYSIVRNHGGILDLRTKSGEGSTFMIYLPAIAGEGRIESAVRPQELPRPRRARVLVMDDEEILRNLSSELLGALGHDVEVAKHGQEALEKYQGAIAAGSPFDIVILDLTVRGGMGGAETVRKLLGIDPAVKAIVSSGYSGDATTVNYEKLGFKAFLKKPYNVDALREVLYKMLSI